MSEAGQPRNGVALVVGVGQYQHPPERISHLKYAAADAEAISELLGDTDCCYFPNSHIATLIDDKANRDNIVHHLMTWLPDRARGAEVVVLYFAGHGTVCQVGTKAEGYFLAYDADPDNPMARGVAMSDVAKCMEGLQASAVVLCLDCCHAGQVLYRDPAPSQRDLAIRPSALQNLAGKNRFILASCDEGEFSVELPEIQHGLFTYHLLHGLRGHGDLDGDGKVGVDELFTYVAQAVKAEASKKGVKQQPWKSSVGGAETYLSIPKSGRKPFDVTMSFNGFVSNISDKEPADLVRETEKQIETADEATLVQMLKKLGRLADPAAVPVLFRCLSNTAPAVRRHAKHGIQAIGVDRSFQTIADLAKKPNPAVLTPIIDGLNVYDAEPRLVTLLNRLVNLLQGDLLVHANSVLEQKRLSLGLDTMAALFREKNTGYELVGVLGQGLFAAAYEARDEFSGHSVVVRVLRSELVQQADIRKQFLDLCKQSVKLVHQNLVVTRRGGELPDRDIYYVVRDYVDRKQPLLREMIKGGHRFDAQLTVLILKQLLGALSVVHAAQLFHGGVKPSNIFICDPNYFVMLGDLAPPPQGVGASLAKRLVYDYRYAAPEVLHLDSPGPAADIYALGCVAYEMLSGAPPFTGDTYMAISVKHLTMAPPAITRLRPDLPNIADDVFAQLMAKSPMDRPLGAAAVALVERLLEKPPPRWSTPQLGSPPPAKPLANYKPIVSMMSIGISKPFVSMPEMEPTTIPPQNKPTAQLDSLKRDSEFELSLDDSGVKSTPPGDPVEDQGDIFETNFSIPAISDDVQDSEEPTDLESSDFDLALDESDVQPSLDNKAAGPEIVLIEDDHLPSAQTQHQMRVTEDPITLEPTFTGDRGPKIPDELLHHHHYTDVRVLGSGGMGTVFLARNRMLDRLEVLKVMHRFNSNSAEERFLREIRATARLQHPNIVVAYSSFKLGDQFVLAMEYVQGSNLTDIVRRHGPLPIPQACNIIRQAAEGLQHAHERGMVHRDIKPSNLMLTTDGNSRRLSVVKILDFGLAQLRSDAARAELTITGAVMGTPQYMPPEQARNSAGVDHRADIYSLGATLFFLLTGRPPFQGGTLMDVMTQLAIDEAPLVRTLRPDTPRVLSDIVKKILAKRADDRFQTPREVAEVLKKFVSPVALDLEWDHSSPIVADENVPDTFGTVPSASALQAPPPPREGWWRRFIRWFNE